jgi:hypothetical protein
VSEREQGGASERRRLPSENGPQRDRPRCVNGIWPNKGTGSDMDAHRPRHADIPERLRARAIQVEIAADETHRPRKMLNAAQVMREAADLIEAKSERIRVLEARLAEMGGCE